MHFLNKSTAEIRTEIYEMASGEWEEIIAVPLSLIENAFGPNGQINNIEELIIFLARRLPSAKEEPTNPKDVVMDIRESSWRLLADGDWVCVDGPDIGEYLNWKGLLGRGPLVVNYSPSVEEL